MKYLCSSVIAGSVLPELLLCRRRGKGTRGEGKTAALTIPTGRMMRGARLREAIGPPAMTQCKRAMMCSSSKTTEVMETSVPPIQSSESSMPDSKKGGATVSASMGVRPRWKPSEAHRGSATALRRKKAEDAQLKAGTPPRAPADDGLKARSPGLRRRELLGGASDEPELASSVSASTAKSSAFLSQLTTEQTIASSSATQKYRERRELKRLAAAGNTEAAEALRVLAPPFGGATRSTGDASSDTSAGGAGGLTPLTVLPVLLALIAAGYFAANDLLPDKWLASIGEGRWGGGGQGSQAARSEGYSFRPEYAMYEGEGVAERTAAMRGSFDDGVRWQQQQQQLRRLSSAASSSLVAKRLSLDGAVPTAMETPPDASMNVGSSDGGRGVHR